MAKPGHTEFTTMGNLSFLIKLRRRRRQKSRVFPPVSIMLRQRFFLKHEKSIDFSLIQALYDSFKLRPKTRRLSWIRVEVGPSAQFAIQLSLGTKNSRLFTQEIHSVIIVWRALAMKPRCWLDLPIMRSSLKRV